LAKAQSLSVEITEHLGHDKHDPASRDRGNSRNGARSKMELTRPAPAAKLTGRRFTHVGKH
jgi:transposase-like protein